MPAPTYKPLANVILSSSNSSITFDNIPSTYKDLVLTIQASAVTQGFEAGIFFNSDTSSANYKRTRMYVDSTIKADYADGNSFCTIQTNLTTAVIQITDYSDTNKNTNFLSRWGTAQSTVGATVSRWANTQTVTTLEIKDVSNTYIFASGSTFSLYGIAG
jgi:hypothetical protein